MLDQWIKRERIGLYEKLDQAPAIDAAKPRDAGLEHSPRALEPANEEPWSTENALILGRLLLGQRYEVEAFPCEEPLGEVSRRYRLCAVASANNLKVRVDPRPIVPRSRFGIDQVELVRPAGVEGGPARKRPEG